MIVRELITLLGFRINESQFRSTEARIRGMQRTMQNFGMKATLFFTAPFVALNIWMGKTLSSFEQIDVAFQTMIGDTQQAKGLVEDMLQFAAKTPFEVKDIGNVVKQLLATGSSVETVIDDLRILGNAASGVNVPIQRLALNFGQVRAMGKLTGRELRDFTTAGINIRKELSKITGKSIDEVSNMVTRGEVSFDMLRQVFTNMSAEGGIFFNLMIKQSKTLGGMWSNFKDILALTVRDFSQDLLPLFKKIVLWFIKMVDIFKNQVTPTMKRMIWFFGLFLALLGPITLAMWAFISAGKAIASVLIFISGAARAANMSMLLFLGKFALIAIAILAAIGLAAVAFEDIFTFMKGGESATGRIIALMDVLNEKLKKLGSFTLNMLKRLLGNMSGIFDGFFETIIGLFTKRWKFAGLGFLKLLENSIMLMANTILTIFQPLFDIINLIFKTKFDLGAGLDKNVADLKSIVKATPSAVKTFSQGFIEQAVSLPGHVERIGKAAIMNAATSGFGVTPGGGINQFNINTDITLPVPEGTPSAQIEHIDITARKAVEEQFKHEIRKLTNAMPEKE
jgi:tape measure domain-containing protein